MRDIAHAAGVAVETVGHANFRSKSELLTSAVDAAVVGDAEPVPLADRPVFARLGSGTRSERVAAGRPMLSDIHRRAGGLAFALREAAAADPDLARTLDEAEERRRVSITGGSASIFGHELPTGVRDGPLGHRVNRGVPDADLRSGWTPRSTRPDGRHHRPARTVTVATRKENPVTPAPPTNAARPVAPRTIAPRTIAPECYTELVVDAPLKRFHCGVSSAIPCVLLGGVTRTPIRSTWLRGATAAALPAPGSVGVTAGRPAALESGLRNHLGRRRTRARLAYGAVVVVSGQHRMAHPAGAARPADPHCADLPVDLDAALVRLVDISANPLHIDRSGDPNEDLRRLAAVVRSGARAAAPRYSGSGSSGRRLASRS